MTATKKKATAPKAKVGRPTLANTAARETFQFRVTSEQRAPWQAAAEASRQSESDWARVGLDAWAEVCARAAMMGTDPHALLEESLEAHARVRAAVDELDAAGALSATEARLFRVLAPSVWARRQEDRK